MWDSFHDGFVAANDTLYTRETYIPDSDFRGSYALPGNIHIILTGDGDREEGWDWIYTDGADFDEAYPIIIWILSDLSSIKQSFDDWVCHDRELIREKLHTIDQHIDAIGGYHALSLDDLSMLIRFRQYIEYPTEHIEGVMKELELMH